MELKLPGSWMRTARPMHWTACSDMGQACLCISQAAGISRLQNLQQCYSDPPGNAGPTLTIQAGLSQAFPQHSTHNPGHAGSTLELRLPVRHLVTCKTHALDCMLWHGSGKSPHLPSSWH